MDFNFTSAASTGGGQAIKLPKNDGESITFTMGNQVRIAPNLEYNTKARQYDSKGRLKVQWELSVIDEAGNEGRVFVDKPGARSALADAMLANNISKFFEGDKITITFTGKVPLKTGGMMNAYKASIEHDDSNSEARVINATEESQEAGQQAQQAYNQQAPQAPQAPAQNPYVQRGGQQGYGQQAQQAYPQQGFDQQYPQQGYGNQPTPPAPPVPGDFAQGTSDQHPWG